MTQSRTIISDSVKRVKNTNYIQTIVSDGNYKYKIEGHVLEGFDPVLNAFIDNFKRGEEVGATVAVYFKNILVAHLWGGYKDGARLNDWQEDTIINMMSVAKGFAAFCVHWCVEKGLLDLNTPVSTYWPEFAQGGKANIPVSYLLDHRAGLPIITADLKQGAIYNTPEILRALAEQATLWEPGTQAGYHILTQGYLLGELVFRVTGKTLGTILQEAFAEPLKLDYQLGVAAEDIHRTADFLVERKGTIMDKKALDPESLLAKSWRQVPEDEDFNGLWRNTEIPSGNGHGTAEAVARFYAALSMGGTFNGIRILKDQTISMATTLQHEMTEVMMGRTYRQALGILLNSQPIVWMGPNKNSFGHHGLGGSIGMADPDAHIGFSYACNKMHARIDNGPRAGSLIKAVYACLENT